MVSSTETPPPFEAHVTELESSEDGKITNVAVYSGRAEVTRTFRFSLKAGQNQVHVNGLPNVMDQDSLRVEGRGAGTIQEVSISYIPAPPTVQDSPQIRELQDEKEVLEQSSYRAKRSLESLDKYIATLTSTSIPSSQLKEALAEYNTSAREYQTEIRALRDQLKEAEIKIAEERKKRSGKERNTALNLKASIGVFVEEEGEVEIGLVYAVTGASWAPKYDIRVDSQSKEKPVTLVYKGSLTQNTGEDWTDVPLVLETATPTFNNVIPELYPWTITIHRPMPPPAPLQYSALRKMAPAGQAVGGMPQMQVMELASARSPPPPPSRPAMSVQAAEVSKGGGANVSATFSVPGKMTVPSDGASHNVTIVQLTLDAKMTWVSVPKKDTKVHLSAKIKNTSEFLLLAGSASVYVDGSFISRSNVPSVSPDESFDCPLGLDPAIKVTYHPQTKKLSQSGLINKTDVYLYTQRITVHNMKNIEVENVKLIDQIPISEDATVNVKLISPALQLPGSSLLDAGSVRSSKGFSLGGSGKSENSSTPSVTKVPAPVKVSKEVTAKWDDGNEDEENVDMNSLGKDGKINFVCALVAQGKTNVTLQWEVTAPTKTQLYGL